MGGGIEIAIICEKSKAASSGSAPQTSRTTACNLAAPSVSAPGGCCRSLGAIGPAVTALEGSRVCWPRNRACRKRGLGDPKPDPPAAASATGDGPWRSDHQWRRRRKGGWFSLGAAHPLSVFRPISRSCLGFSAAT